MELKSLTVMGLLWAMPALAQSMGKAADPAASGLSFYGLLDAGVARVSHTLNMDPCSPTGTNLQATKYGAKAAVGLVSGGRSPSRLGLRGSLILFPGLKGVLNLEHSLNVRNGTVSNSALGLAHTVEAGSYMSVDSAHRGQWFSRCAYVGIASDSYGTLTFGRHTGLMTDILAGYDGLQSAQLLTPIGYSGSYGGGGATDGGRVDNSVKYKLTHGQISVGLLRRFGGVAGSPQAIHSDQLAMGFEKGPFGLQVAYQAYTDAVSLKNPGGSALGTLSIQVFNAKGVMVAGRYKKDPYFVAGGFERMKCSNPSHPQAFSTLTSLFGLPVSKVDTTPYTVAGQETKKVLDLLWLSGAYDVLPSLNLALGYYQIHQHDFSLGTQPAGSKASGNSRFYSFLVDYKLGKSYDAYLGYAYNKVSGGLGEGFAHKNNSTTILGIRYKF